MPIEDHFSEIKEEVNKELEKFFEAKFKQIENERKPKEIYQMTKNLKKFILNSGKRIRPILFYYGYVISGGENKREIIRTAISVELIHSYLLIHDDIIDQDNFRHGGPSMHFQYEKKYHKRFNRENSKHLGASMAIILGDLASVMGYEILVNANFSDDLKVKALKKMDEIISNTILGQSLDITLETDKRTSAKRIFQMQKYKTAKYTIEGPLHLGAVLANADINFLSSLSKFSIPLGIAYQIKDDIIGVFGSKKKTGKPVGSDIREGKKTLLIIKAIQKADEKQKKIIKEALGNEAVTSKEIEMVKNVMVKTGALDFSLNKCEELADVSKKYLKDIKIDEKNRKFLSDLTDFIAKREY